MIRKMLIPLAVVAALAAPATAQAISASQAGTRAQLYFQAKTKPGTYNPSSYYWNCEERFFGWACTSFVRMYPPICYPPLGDGRLVVSVHMNHRGTGRRFSAYHCSRFI